MAKQWTRNYDNLFSFAFGAINYSGTSLDGAPIENKPCFRNYKGDWYCPGSNYTSSVACSLIIPPPLKYYTTGKLSTGFDDIGIGLGSSSVTPTYEDYQLDSPYTSSLTLGTISTSFNYNEETHTYTKTYKCPIAYAGTEDIVVAEFGLYTGSTYDTYGILIYRETLDEPITLSQNDTIEITFSQSIVQPNYTPYPTE